MSSTNRVMVFDGRLGRHRPLLNGTPEWTSESANWQGLSMEMHDPPSFELRDGFSTHTLVLLHLGHSMVIEYKDKGRYLEQRIRGDSISIVPSGMYHSVRCQRASRILCLALDSATMEAAESDFMSPQPVELTWQRGIEDPLIREIASTLKREIEGGRPFGSLHAESLRNTLATHLLRHYAARPLQVRELNGGLPKPLLQRALDYIHENAQQAITLHKIAASIGMSPFHFSRQFKKSVGQPPYRYVLNWRIQTAAKLLVTGHYSVAQVSTKFCFSDQSHFSSHFKKLYGMTPSSFIRSRRN